MTWRNDRSRGRFFPRPSRHGLRCPMYGAPRSIFLPACTELAFSPANGKTHSSKHWEASKDAFRNKNGVVGRTRINEVVQGLGADPAASLQKHKSRALCDHSRSERVRIPLGQARPTTTTHCGKPASEGQIIFWSSDEIRRPRLWCRAAFGIAARGLPACCQYSQLSVSFPEKKKKKEDGGGPFGSVRFRRRAGVSMRISGSITG